MSIFHRFNGDRLLIIWIRDNIYKEELKEKNEKEINEYIYNKLKIYNYSHHLSLNIHLCKSWLKTGRLYEIVLLLGYFGGKNYLKEAKLYYEWKITPPSWAKEYYNYPSYDYYYEKITTIEELKLKNKLKN